MEVRWSAVVGDGVAGVEKSAGKHVVVWGSSRAVVLSVDTGKKLWSASFPSPPDGVALRCDAGALLTWCRRAIMCYTRENPAGTACRWAPVSEIVGAAFISGRLALGTARGSLSLATLQGNELSVQSSLDLGGCQKQLQRFVLSNCGRFAAGIHPAGATAGSLASGVVWELPPLTEGHPTAVAFSPPSPLLSLCVAVGCDVTIFREAPVPLPQSPFAFIQQLRLTTVTQSLHLFPDRLVAVEWGANVSSLRVYDLETMESTTLLRQRTEGRNAIACVDSPCCVVLAGGTATCCEVITRGLADIEVAARRIQRGLCRGMLRRRAWQMAVPAVALGGAAACNALPPPTPPEERAALVLQRNWRMWAARMRVTRMPREEIRAAGGRAEYELLNRERELARAEMQHAEAASRKEVRLQEREERAWLTEAHEVAAGIRERRIPEKEETAPETSNPAAEYSRERHADFVARLPAVVAEVHRKLRWAHHVGSIVIMQDRTRELQRLRDKHEKQYKDLVSQLRTAYFMASACPPPSLCPLHHLEIHATAEYLAAQALRNPIVLRALASCRRSSGSSNGEEPQGMPLPSDVVRGSKGRKVNGSPTSHTPENGLADQGGDQGDAELEMNPIISRALSASSSSSSSSSSSQHSPGGEPDDNDAECQAGTAMVQINDLWLCAAMRQLDGCEVDLSACSGQLECLMPLFTVLATNTTVQTLRLDHSPVDDETVLALVTTVFPTNTTLQRITLNFTRVTNAAMEIIAEALHCSLPLEAVETDGTEVTYDSALKFRRTLELMRELRARKAREAEEKAAAAARRAKYKRLPFRYAYTGPQLSSLRPVPLPESELMPCPQQWADLSKPSKAKWLRKVGAGCPITVKYY